MVAMESVATHLDEPTGYFVTHWELQDRIAEADKALDQRIAAASAARAAQEASIDEAVSEESASEEEPESSEDAGDFDPEVAAIFTEEATELIEASEHALSDWRSEPGSAEYRLGLKRPLHTLKGGARMAGIMAMGDLSHELETLVMQVDNGTVAPNDALFEVVQASLDELARMRELVANGRRVSSARAMIARIKSLSQPKSAAAPPPAARPAGPASTNAPGRAGGQTFANAVTGQASPPGPPGSAPPFFSEPGESELPEFDTDIAKFGAEIARLRPQTPDVAAETASTEQPTEGAFDVIEDTEATSESALPEFTPSLELPPSLEQPEGSDGLQVGEGSEGIQVDEAILVEEASPVDGAILVSEGESFDEILAADAVTDSSADANAPDSEPTTEQPWLSESSQAPWPADLHASESDPNALTSTVASLDDAANAHAFGNGPDGCEQPGRMLTLGSVPTSARKLTAMPTSARNFNLPTDTDAAFASNLGADEIANFGAEVNESASSDSEPAADGNINFSSSLDAGDNGNADAGMIVVEEPPAFDALPAVDAPAPEIERLSATGVHTAPIEAFEAAARLRKSLLPRCRGAFL